MIGSMIGPSSQCWQPMLAIDIGPMIDRGLDDNCGPILVYYVSSKSLPIIREELLPELSRRPFKFTLILIMTIKFKTKRIINTN